MNIHEDELPAMTDKQYSIWFKQSFIPGDVGCRIGPEVDLNGDIIEVPTIESSNEEGVTDAR